MLCISFVIITFLIKKFVTVITQLPFNVKKPVFLERLLGHIIMQKVSYGSQKITIFLSWLI
ncbi:hypothetical protein QV08_09305 [Gallibacterium salpingitidis]|uniref:Uncharacterized protein n=1 Tax=Gallibacterium salpingitidis TaxID=505341 RepID=A0A1A7P1S5_9PAST|nr:hypothetical protein QS62_00090 [Gallibacterium salpingitidis]OBX06758.1 hypothetical protein QV08_09305 [Gallibacterium salpingitidis]OBX09676.1 hypothetical protein QV09_07670 [Gallibacterium salpingitidis]